MKKRKITNAIDGKKIIIYFPSDKFIFLFSIVNENYLKKGDFYLN
jgi:hypothetical protein